MSKNPEGSAPVSSLKLFLELLPYARRRWVGLVWISFTTLLSIGLGALKPWPMKFIIDRVLLDGPLTDRAGRVVQLLPGAGSPRALLYWGVAATVVMFVLSWGLRFANAVTQVWFGQRMAYDLASDHFARLQRFSLRYHHRKPVGDSIRRVTSDCG